MFIRYIEFIYVYVVYLYKICIKMLFFCFIYFIYIYIKLRWWVLFLIVEDVVKSRSCFFVKLKYIK